MLRWHKVDVASFTRCLFIKTSKTFAVLCNLPLQQSLWIVTFSQVRRQAYLFSCNGDGECLNLDDLANSDQSIESQRHSLLS